MCLNKFAIVSVASILVLAACSSEDTTPPGPASSSVVIFKQATILDGNVNDPSGTNTAPEISANGLELYFQSDRTSSMGSMDLYVAKRTSTSASWGAATNLGAPINTVGQERGPALSNDGLTLIFSSDRGGPGSVGALDLYMSTRASLSDPWSSPVNLGNVINTVDLDSGADISADGLSLYFYSNTTSSSFGLNDIYVSTRATVVDPWGPPSNLGSLINTSVHEQAPEIASDGLSLYFHTNRSGGPGANNIWRSTRASTSASWSAPVVLDAPVNSSGDEFAPSLSSDWQSLYFTSDFGGNRDIWVATP